MKRLDAPGAILAGAALVLLANVAVLGAAWWNRAGEPESRLEVSKRELALPLWRDKDHTGLVLTLALADRPPDAVAGAAVFRRDRLSPFEHAWLDAAKLGELGFDLGAIEAAARKDLSRGRAALAPTRSAFVVLEYDGESWRAWLARREAEVGALRERVESGLEDRGTLAEAEALLAIDRTSRSRLMPVDAGLDPAALRARYPDRSRCAVVPAFVGVRARIAEGSSARFRGTIENLAVEGITVPPDLLPPLDPFVPRDNASEVSRRAREDAVAARWPAPTAPRYRATLVYGRRLDPWLADVAPP